MAVIGCNPMYDLRLYPMMLHQCYLYTYVLRDFRPLPTM